MGRIIKEMALNGKLVMNDEPLTIGDNFQQLTNLRYTNTNPQGVTGMSKATTIALGTVPSVNQIRIQNGFRLIKSGFRTVFTITRPHDF
jgi:hypothetical protein